jgi:hypothetical protein
MDLGIGSDATGLKNVQIGATPAEIAGHSAQKLRFRRRWSFVQKAFEAHDLAGRTEAALKGIGVDEGLLHGIEYAMLRKAFDGGDGLTFTVDGQA